MEDTENPTTPAVPFSNVPHKRRFISLTTYRQSGQGVPTPLWFGWSDRGIYVVTPATAGKLKRLSRNSAVSVAPCRSQGAATGPERSGVAVILDGEQRRRAAKAIARRYFLPAALIEWEMRRRGQGNPPVYLEVRET